jgi:hypothetical protein
MFLFLINFASASVNIETSTYTNNGILGLTATENLQNFIFTTITASDIVYYSNDSTLNFYESDSEIVSYPSNPIMTNDGNVSYFNDAYGLEGNGGKLYKSTNKGINWVENPLIVNGEDFGNITAYNIALSNDGKYIYILLTNLKTGLLKSDNYGENFTLIENVTDIAISGVFVRCSENGKYIIINNWNNALMTQDIIYSDDYGETFNIVVENSEIPLNNVYNIDNVNNVATITFIRS